MEQWQKQPNTRQIRFILEAQDQYLGEPKEKGQCNHKVKQIKPTSKHATYAGKWATLAGTWTVLPGARHCSKCQGRDHFATVCRTKPKMSGNKQSSAYAVDADASTEYAFAVNSQDPMLEVTIGQRPLKVLVDSGATSNVLSTATWKQLKQEGIRCASKEARGKKLCTYASDVPLQVKGTFTRQAECGSQSTQAEFLVLDNDGVPLLGKDTAIELGVLKVGVDVAAISHTQNIPEMYPELFKGVGKLNTHQVTLHIKKDVPPIAQPMRRIPYNLRDKVENKIQELLNADIIEHVDGPTR